MSIQKLEELIPCFLELISINGAKELSLQRIADELGVPASDIEKVVAIAQTNDLISTNKGVFKITKKGKEVLRAHRENFLHDRFIHPSKGLRTIFRRRRRGRRNSENHSLDWDKHGLTNSNMTDFYQNLEEIEGRIEDIIPLAYLHEGEKGIIQFMFGGRGQVQRLADLGLTPGAEIIIKKKAPFHGPIEIYIRNACLVIGNKIAQRVFVKPKGQLSRKTRFSIRKTR
ncbi:MAG: ferrous iron transport protein A [Promethearchaeota archaeon]